jgi:hypothetical protein
MPVEAQTDQMFSHFHLLTNFVGAAKLPFKNPAVIHNIIPSNMLCTSNSDASRLEEGMSKHSILALDSAMY